MKDMAEKNIFVRQLDDERNLLYMPLCGYATIVGDHDLATLRKFCNGSLSDAPSSLREITNRIGVVNRTIYITPRNVSGLKNMMLLPNNRCNFSCSYCYSAFGRNGKEVSLTVLRTALDYFFDINRCKGERLTISVLGGGEPLLSWHTLQPALDYAYSLADKRKSFLPVSLVTNGSILTNEILCYLKAHQVSVSVSFDILPDIQNEQRGHYDLVVENIRRMVDYGLDIAFNTVITEKNVERMDEMILHVSKHTPGVKKISFKSLITDSIFSSTRARRHYYRQYVDGFYAAHDLAKQHGIWLTSPYYNNALCISDRYCPGKFVVTSQGDISVCHCVGSTKDKYYDKFIFGTIKDGKVKIDETRLDRILAHDNIRNERCQTCIAHWHCAGGCYADNTTVGENNVEAQEAYCESMRYFMEIFIKRNLIGNDR